MNEQNNVEKLKSERVQEEAPSRKRRLPPPDDTIGAEMSLTRSPEAVLDLPEQLG